MALTLSTYPYDSAHWIPANIPLWHTYSSSLASSAIDGIRFTIEVNGTQSTQFVQRFNTSDRVHFNLQPYLRDVCEVADRAVGSSKAIHAEVTQGKAGTTRTSAQVIIRAREWYDGSAVSGSSDLVRVYYITPSSYGIEEGQLDWDNWVAQNNTTQGPRFLTDRSYAQTYVEVHAGVGDQMIFAWINDSIAANAAVSSIIQLRVKGYNAAGNQLGTTYTSSSVASSHQSPTSTAYGTKVCHTMLGPAQLQTANAFNFNGYASTWAYVDVELGYPGPGNYAKIRLLRRDRPCDHLATQLAWANRAGGWDYLRFDNKVQVQATQERKLYRPTVFDTSGTLVSWGKQDSEEAVYQSRSQKRYVLSHLGHTLAEAQLLEYAMRARKAAIRIGYGDWIPVTISQGSLQIEQDSSSRMFNTSLEVLGSQAVVC